MRQGKKFIFKEKFRKKQPKGNSKRNYKNGSGEEIKSLVCILSNIWILGKLY